MGPVAPHTLPFLYHPNQTIAPPPTAYNCSMLASTGASLLRGAGPFAAAAALQASSAAGRAYQAVYNVGDRCVVCSTAAAGQGNLLRVSAAPSDAGPLWVQGGGGGGEGGLNSRQQGQHTACQSVRTCV